MKNLVLLVVVCLSISVVAVLWSGKILATSAEEEDHGGDIIYTKPVKAVIFSHKAHSEDIGMQCEWCHDETFEMEALAVQSEEGFSMTNQCNDQYCGVCHNGDISFSITAQCTKCHIGVRGYKRLVKEGKIIPESEETDTKKSSNGSGYTISKFIMPESSDENEHESLIKMVDEGYFPEDIQLTNAKKTNIAIFSHESHLQRKQLACTQCHPKIFIMKKHDKIVRSGHLNMEDMEKGKYCGSCHDGEKAFGVKDRKDCKKCHI